MEQYNVVPHDSLLIPSSSSASTAGDLSFITTTATANPALEKNEITQPTDHHQGKKDDVEYDQEYQQYLQHHDQLKDNEREKNNSNAITPTKQHIPSPRCKLSKCCVCLRGVPDSFAQSKPISWLSVCRLAMWALMQDGQSSGKKWFSLGRDICPFVEAHRQMCGRDFTVNWKTTIGITMSTYCKKGNYFISGNANEHGLGFYSLPDDAADPYTATALQPGRVYRSPSSHLSQDEEEPNGNPSEPSSRKRKKTSFPGFYVYRDSNISPVSSPTNSNNAIIPTTNNGNQNNNNNKERKHTTDQEKQLLLDYYEKYGTNTTSPEYSALQAKLGWDHHRTKIWLYNRKTYHQKPTTFEETIMKQKRKKRQKLGEDDDSNDQSTMVPYNSNMINSSMDDDSEEDVMYAGTDEEVIEQLRRRLHKENFARKSAVTQCMLKDEQIAALEQTLADASQVRSDDPDVEISLLRKQVDLYSRELRDEKRKRGEQEVVVFDMTAQINTLKLRNIQLEKLLQKHLSTAGELEGEMENNTNHNTMNNNNNNNNFTPVAGEKEGEANAVK